MIHLITGCMGSGKTERLISLADQVPDGRKLILGLGKMGEHNVFTKTISSRNGRTILCSNVSLMQKMLAEIPNTLTDVFVDEGQWAYPQRILNAKRLSDRGLNIYVSLLDRTYTGEHYDTFLRWEAVADEITVMHGVCAVTGGCAEYSELLTDVESVRKEDYRAVCHRIFKESKHCRI